MIRRARPFGDSAWLVEVDSVDAAHRLARLLRQEIAADTAPVAVGDIVVGFRSVVVHVDPLTNDPGRCESWLAGLEGSPWAGSEPGPLPAPARRIDVPATFDGPDLGEAAAAAGITADAVVELLTGCELRVAFLGFSPGFPYLVGLPPALEGIHRRATPRTSVPAGSVALAGGFAAIYPHTTPGGWMLVGRTSLPLFDPEVPPYARLRAGDLVRFRKPDRADAVNGIGDDRPGLPTARAPQRAHSRRFVEVVEPGLQSLVQDGGRTSVASIGIPDAGPADPDSMRLANRLAGNSDDAAVIEVTARGPTLRFRGDAHIGVVAATSDAINLTVDGRAVGIDTVVPIRDGQTLSAGQVGRGLRAYIGIAGGIETPRVVGSRSSDVLTGLGLGALVVGDQLDLGTPRHPRGFLTHTRSDVLVSDPAFIRVVAGPHGSGPTELEALCSTEWRVADASNRVGLRLSAPHTDLASTGRIESTGTVTGAVQIPPDGQPIVLMPDHATVGGYPVIACVITADLGVLGQLRGGDRLLFELVTHPVALDSLVEHERRLTNRVSGWFPAESGT
ncbi:MAG TPA: carboxyltransferase domain-containing protein [Acidimicrobiales bacterium]|nr:carboxyltransferase domain-containing protein [Acidimicrobiales bacterium]